jgi:hypothetical protein
LAIEILWLIIIGLMLVGGVAMRVWRRRLPSVELQKVSPWAASQLVGEFLQSCYDGQFGFPSGLFLIDHADEHQVSATEVVSKGSHFTAILGGMYRALLGIGSAFGCWGALIGLTLSIFLTPFLLYAALTEIVLRYLLRSQIIADLAPAGEGTKVTFTLRGPVALLVGQRLEHAFLPPTLPLRIATMAGISP